MQSFFILCRPYALLKVVLVLEPKLRGTDKQISFIRQELNLILSLRSVPIIHQRSFEWLDIEKLLLEILIR